MTLRRRGSRFEVRGSLALALVLVAAAAGRAQVRLADETDRAAFRSWFAFLADAQFVRRSADVTDCAALVRHAFREALRAHTAEWRRLNDVPALPAFTDVRRPPRADGDAWPLFRVSADTRSVSQEFADARSIVQFNSRRIGRDVRALQPGDLLYFVERDRRSDHLMVFVGRSRFEADGDDWVVYHTGPDGSDPGEVRKVTVRELVAHPRPRWRPIASNAQFAGIYRLAAVMP